MEKEFVPYDIALAMKELGFDEPCFGYFNPDEELVYGIDIKTVEYVLKYHKEDKSVLAPLYQQAFRWFREKYNLWGKAGFVDEFYTDYSKSDYTQISEIRHEYNPEMTAEETTDVIKREEIKCLKTLIKVVKNKYQ